MNSGEAVKEKGTAPAAKQKARAKGGKPKALQPTAAEKEATAQEELAREKVRGDRAESALDGLKSRAETAERQLAIVQGELKGQKADKAGLLNQTTLAKNRCDELAREAKASADKVDPLQKEVSALSKRIVEADKETAAQRMAYEEVRKKIGPLRQEISALQGSFPMAQIARDAALENLAEERDKRKKFKRDLDNLREKFDQIVDAGRNALPKLPDGGEAAALKEALPRSANTRKKG